MKIKTVSIFLLITSFIFSGCTSENFRMTDVRKSTSELDKVNFFAMDTYMTISAYGTDADRVLHEVEVKILELESLWSISSEDSEISRLNREGAAEVSHDTISMIQTAMRVSANTENAFDITIFPLVEAWGFTTDDTYRIPDETELSYLKTFVNSERITIKGNSVTLENGMALIYGAIAKGYASETAVNMLKERGISSAIMSLGGNVQVLGTKPDGSLWNIAIQDPKDPRNYAGAIKIADKAVITSGTYQRYFEQDGFIFHHLIDPSTGKPANNGLLSVTIIADNGTVADALSTAMFIMGEDKAIDFWRIGAYDFEMILISQDDHIQITEGIQDLFIPDSESTSVSVIPK